MDEIRSWWEIPCVSHFCHIFAKPFKLPDFEIEELEDTLLLDEPKEDPTPSLLVKLYCALLNGIVDKDVSEENWEFFMKMHLEWRCEYLHEKFNPHEGKTYKELTTRNKVDIIHHICHWRMELDDIGELLRGQDGPLLRVEPLGKDDDGNIYWYFYGTRLYMETAKKKIKKNGLEGTPGKGRGRSKGKTKEIGKMDDKEEGVWKIVCSTSDEWEEIVDRLRECKKTEARRLCNYINVELLPEVLYLLQQKEKIFKRKLLMELPRRTSDRIAQKALKIEEERYDALEREIQREEQRKEEEEEKAREEEEAEKKHQEKMAEVIQRRKARKEEQEKQRQQEEENWSRALSGELSGPRKAALGAVQGVVQTQHLIEAKDEDLYTDMYKALNGLRKLEDSWVFEDPVTEDIAPGYFDVVEKPMDYSTVEKKIEKGSYVGKEEFIADVELIFNNCKDYNGEDSEYYDLANEMLETFHKLMQQLEGEVDDDEDDEGKKKKKKKSPSPELTSESSEESEEEEEEEDGEEGTVKKVKRTKELSLHKPLIINSHQPGMYRHHPPNMYPPHHMMPPQMRPPHIPPEMMMYPPHPYYGHYTPHPMQMRPHPREAFFPPEAYRYPYHMNGMPPPPPYQQSVMPNERFMMQQEHRMPHRMPHPPQNGPMHPPMLANDPPAHNDVEKDVGQRVSSPRISSTVQTPPTSGDEKSSEVDDNKLSQAKENETISSETPNEKTEQPTSEKPKEQKEGGTQTQSPKPHPHPQRPNPHGMHHMRGGYPQPPGMMDERQRYYHAMMMRRQMMSRGGYPSPDEAYYMWNGQRPPHSPYGPTHQPHPSQLAMIEKQRYMENQMRLRAAHAGGGQRPTRPVVNSRGKGEGETGRQGGKTEKGEEDIPDYHDSLTRYALGLASSEEEKDEGRKNEPVKEGEEDGTQESSSEQTMEKEKLKMEQLKLLEYRRMQQMRASWPHPPHPSHMMSNGYEGGMPHPQLGHMMPPHMYGQHPSNMPYPPYQDPYSGRVMMTPEMERWKYMEMQRQMMVRSNPQNMSPMPMKRPLQQQQPVSQHDHVTNGSESHDQAEPPQKQAKISEDKEHIDEDVSLEK